MLSLLLYFRQLFPTCGKTVEKSLKSPISSKFQQDNIFDLLKGCSKLFDHSYDKFTDNVKKKEKKRNAHNCKINTLFISFRF